MLTEESGLNAMRVCPNEISTGPPNGALLSNVNVVPGRNPNSFNRRMKSSLPSSEVTIALEPMGIVRSVSLIIIMPFDHDAIQSCQIAGLYPCEKMQMPHHQWSGCCQYKE